MADSPLRTIAESVDWSETQVTTGSEWVPLCLADPRRVYLRFVMSTAGSDNVSTNPDAAVQGGFNISAGEDVELEIRKHGTLVGAAWFISPDIGVNTVTVFQVWFPRE